MDFKTLDTTLLQKNGKIIHQIWFDMGNGNSPPDNYTKSWHQINTEYTYNLWNETHARELIKTHYKFFLRYYDKYPYTIQRIDALRYFFLHRYGGFYCDTDFECLIPIRKIMKKYLKDVYLVGSPNCVDFLFKSISNSFMYSKPMNKFWKKVHQELISRFNNNYYIRHIQIMKTTGPSMLTDLYNKYKDKFKVGLFPYQFFNPCSLCEDRCQKTVKMFTIHRNSGSWERLDSQFFKFILCNWKVLVYLIFIVIIICIKHNS